MYNNDQLVDYAKPLSNSEKEKCESSIRVFEKILKDYGFSVDKTTYESNDDELDYGFHISNDNLTAEIFIQGSYGNGTCVRQESDVDIAMIIESTFRGEYPAGKTYEDYGFIKSNFDILNFKKDLVNFINTKYSQQGYRAKNSNKCIDFKGNDTSRKDMDIVPSLRYRDYSRDKYCDEDNYSKGVLIKCNDGTEVYNYPEQSHKNSIYKNNETGYYYKKVVRALKKIKHDMEDDGIQEAKDVSSYGLECLIYNVPSSIFKKDNPSNNFKYIVDKVITYLVLNRSNIENYLETNEILRIFSNKKNNINTFSIFLSKMDKYYKGE